MARLQARSVWLVQCFYLVRQPALREILSAPDTAWKSRKAAPVARTSFSQVVKFCWLATYPAIYRSQLARLNYAAVWAGMLKQTSENQMGVMPVLRLACSCRNPRFQSRPSNQASRLILLQKSRVIWSTRKQKIWLFTLA